MTVRLYQSTDAGAPVLTGQVGSLTAVLDAVLVNGYGTKTAAGWSIEQTTTNKRGYKQGAGGNHPDGMYFYVDDTGPGSHGGREARVCGFETMTAVTPAGTGQFPQPSQSAVGFGALVIRKSHTTDAVARRWVIVANAWTFYLFMEIGRVGYQPIPALGYAFMFGDYISYKTGDAYAQVIIGRAAEAQEDPQYEPLPADHNGSVNYDYSPLSSDIYGHFFARHWNQTQVSARGGKLVPMMGNGYGLWQAYGSGQVYGSQASNVSGANHSHPSSFPYPNPVDGSLWLSPFYLNQAGMRGYLPGLWAPQHHLPLNMYDTFTATSGDMAGKSFIAAPGAYMDHSNSRRACQFFVEFSDTWA